MEQAAAQYPGYERRWIGLAFIGISLIVISLDNTILNVALPSISRTLGATATELQWIIDAYVLVFAALLLTTGSFGDRIGRKRALQVGLVMFGIGSLAAALSTTTLMLIATRAFLGIGGALIMPATLSIVSATFPPQERPQAFAMWAAVFGLGVGIGPVAGGWLVEHFAWSSVFYVNLPVIAIALIGGQIFLAESKDANAPRPDIPGVILSIIGLFSLIYAIIEAGVTGWTNPPVIAAFVVAFAVLGAFFWWERRSPNAMLPMYLFQNRTFASANLSLVFMSFSLFGAVFFLTQYLQTVHGFTAFEAGLRILPQAIALTFMASNSARIAQRFGTKNAVAIGLLLAALAMLYMSLVFNEQTPYFWIAVGQVSLAAGLGIAISPATNCVMSCVPVARAGIGSAMNDTTRQLGGAIGIAVLGTILNSRYLQGIEPLRSELFAPIFNTVTNSVQAAHVVASSPLMPQATGERIIEVSNAAFLNGMSTALFIGAGVMLVSALFAFRMLPARVAPVIEGMEVEAQPIPQPAGD